MLSVISPSADDPRDPGVMLLHNRQAGVVGYVVMPTQSATQPRSHAAMTCGHDFVGNVGNPFAIAHIAHKAWAWGRGLWVMWAMWSCPHKSRQLDFMHAHTFYAHKMKTL